MIELLDDDEARSVIESQLRDIHSDLRDVRCEDGQGLVEVGSGEEMVRAEFKTDSDTYFLLKLYEKVCDERD